MDEHERDLERRRAVDPPDRPLESLDHDELEELVTGFRPTPDPVMHATNTAIAVGDEIGRLLIALILGTAVLIALAVLVTPWLWLAVAAWVASAVATVLWLRRSRRGRERIVPELERGPQRPL